MTTALEFTTVWTERAVTEAAVYMLMTERQNPDRVAAWLAHMAPQLPTP